MIELTDERIARLWDVLSSRPSKYPTRAGLLGKKVRNKTSGDVGTIVFSTFGISISGISDRSSVEGITEDTHWQTLGDDPEEVMKYWEIIEEDSDD